MRRRRPSGSSGIVEQLTQSYMARKEQIASPPTTPTSGSRLRSPLGGRGTLGQGGKLFSYSVLPLPMASSCSMIISYSAGISAELTLFFLFRF